MIHPEIQRLVAAARIDDLHRTAWRQPVREERPVRWAKLGARLRLRKRSRPGPIIVKPKAQERT